MRSSGWCRCWTPLTSTRSRSCRRRPAGSARDMAESQSRQSLTDILEKVACSGRELERLDEQLNRSKLMSSAMNDDTAAEVAFRRVAIYEQLYRDIFEISSNLPKAPSSSKDLSHSSQSRAPPPDRKS